MYEAWEQQYESTIEDFKEKGLDNEVTIKAKQKEWLEQAPKVLCL